jgi:hypothetical protein
MSQLHVDRSHGGARGVAQPVGAGRAQPLGARFRFRRAVFELLVRLLEDACKARRAAAIYVKNTDFDAWAYGAIRGMPIIQASFAGLAPRYPCRGKQSGLFRRGLERSTPAGVSYARGKSCGGSLAANTRGQMRTNPDDLCPPCPEWTGIIVVRNSRCASWQSRSFRRVGLDRPSISRHAPTFSEDANATAHFLHRKYG